MKPGFELDALVAEKVLGYSIKGGNRYDQDWYLKEYSSRIADAWEIVESFEGYARFAITLVEMPTRYHASVVRHFGLGEFKTYDAEADTAPHAICLAALKAMEI